jgi:hypothetical protein
MKRAVLYARVSTDAQQKEGTVESQVVELRRQIAGGSSLGMLRRSWREKRT